MKTKLLFWSLLLMTFSTFAQYTAIPDSNFEDVLQTLGYDSGINDGQVLTANIIGVKELDIWDYNIADLTGIEDFTDLEVLICYGNNLTSLDVSNNFKLVNLRCSGSLTGYKLTSLKLPNTNSLKELSCSTNALTILDISMCVNLEKLWCYSNNLTALDVSKNTSLIEFSCETNELTYLSIKNGNNASLTSFKAGSNANLTCITVDDTNAIGVNWEKDNTATYSEACDVPKTYVPDNNFEQVLIDLNLDDTLDDYVITANISGITSLDIPNKSIADLKGIENFTALEFLGIQNNNLTTVDLSKNLELNNLSIYTNQLTTLDLSKNLGLTRVNCDENEITVLNLSKNTALVDVSCEANELTYLNVKNGNNSNFIYFRSRMNPNLSCIEVDDKVQSDSWLTADGIGDIDSSSFFSEDCQPKTFIPDNNFEQALIDLNLDDALDDYVITANINTVKELVIGFYGIEDLTGIEAFEDVIYIDVTSNKLTSIDVSKNVTLERLYCLGNTLNTLDVSKNIKLIELSCAYNNIEILDVTSNTNLKELQCYNNQISTLDLTENKALTILYCDSNSLTELNVKNGNNDILTTFNATNNPNLACIQVDNASDSTTNWTSIDATSSFSEDCSPTASVIDSKFNTIVSTYPNPVKNRLYVTIHDGQELESIQVFNILGREILEQKNNNIDFTNISSGMYLVKIKSTKGKIATRKIIKN